MQVRRGDDGFPRAERVRERSARDLVRIEVRRDVHVGGEQVIDDVPLFEVLVHEDDVVGEAELLDESGQSVAVLLAALLEQLRVRLTGDQVERVRMPGDDRRHRLDHVLESLAGTHETEG